MTQPDSQQPVPNTETTPEVTGKINPALVVFLIIPLIGMVVAMLMVINDMQSQVTVPTTADNAPNPAQLVNFAAPEFTLNDLNGQPVNISEYQGRILFLNFWQTTCPPCIEEMPDFIEFIEDQPDDVTWLTINFGENEADVRSFFAEYDFLGIPTVLDPDNSVRYQYGVFGAPVTFVIDPEGVIQYMNIGQLSYDDMVVLANAVREDT